MIAKARLGGAAAAAAILWAPAARSEVRWDASFHEGVALRVLGGGDLTGGVGPVFGLVANVALNPWLRIGAYADHEVAPTGEPVSPRITSFGARVTTGAAASRELRWFLFAGFGYATVAAPAYHQALPLPNATTNRIEDEDTIVSAAGGDFFEIPFGVGAAYSPSRPVEIVAELSGRFGVGFAGSYYDPDGRTGVGATSGATVALSKAGDDVFGIFLTLGVGFAR